MSANRNEDLQRRLGAMQAPAPPDGLAQKIKNEIPKDLRVEARKKSRINLRIAASILVVSIGAYLMFRALPRRSEPLPAAAPAARTAPVARLEEEKRAAVAPESNAVAERRQAPEVRHQTSEGRRQTADVRRQEIARGEAPAKVPMAPVASDEAAKTEVAESAPQAVALAAPAAAPSAGGLAVRAAAAIEESARLNVEATVSPFSGRTMLRITTENAPEANVVVEGAEKIGTDLYAMKGESATVRLQYRQGGAVKSMERAIGPADIRQWSNASSQMKDAVTRADHPQ